MKGQKPKDPTVNQPEFTNQTDKGFTNIKNIPGDSVEEHRNIEFANAIISGNEIKQQNENQ
jgi:hypothetical protein